MNLTELDIARFYSQPSAWRWITLEYSDFQALKGSLSSPMIFTIAIGFATLTSLYARAWSRINPRGPLEALMRKITEGHTK